MKVAIVTNAYASPSRMGWSGGEYVEVTDRLKSEYCSRHGIDYVRTSDDLCPGQHPAWSKPKAMMRVLDRGYDWAVWMDADAAPVSMDADLLCLLSGVGDHVVMQKVKGGFNSGVFAVPNLPTFRSWLEFIESQRTRPEYQSGNVEQLAIVDSFDGQWSRVVTEPPFDFGWNHRTYHFAAFPDLRFWCLHMPGTADSVRNSTFASVEGKVKSGRWPLF